MKKLFLFLFFLLNLNIYKISGSEIITYKGQIRVPKTWSETPNFRLFFNGKTTTNDTGGLYTFKTEKELDKIYILICKEIEPIFDKINTINHIKLNKPKSYKFFSIKKIETAPSIYAWQIKEKTLNKKNFIIPQNCLIASISPKYFDCLKDWNIKFSDNFKTFPEIIFKENLDEKKVKREADKSLIRTLDISLFHEKVDTNKKEDANLKICIIN